MPRQPHRSACSSHPRAWHARHVAWPAAAWGTFAFVAGLATSVHAWTGDAWGAVSRSQIVATANEMIDSWWTPNNTFTMQEYPKSTITYTKGVWYQGIPYSQSNPQYNWNDFSSWVSTTPGGTYHNTGFGNDCSGFVSICWRLPERYWTGRFEDELGTYWDSLGAIGSAQTVQLLPGDALNSKDLGHIILFNRYVTGGIESLEQTPHHATRRTWTWSQLAAYRPIRRKEIAPDVNPPQVQTLAADSVTSSSAVLNAIITSDGGSSVLERRFSWGTTASCSDGWTASVVVNGDNFSYTLSGLDPGTQYYFQASSRNSAGWGEGSSIAFATGAAPDTLPPAVTIENPIDGQMLAASPITVTGTATDTGGSGLRNVIVLNGANGSNGSQLLSGDSASYSVDGIALVPGQNQVSVQAFDRQNNSSDLALVTVTYSPPTVTGISPASGPTAGGTTVTITGTNLADATAVRFGTVAARGFTVGSATQIVATSPAGPVGTVHVTVTTGAGTSATSPADEFTYVAPGLLGDVDGDGHVDAVDLLYLVDAFGAVTGDANYDPRCDFNADGSVDVVDLLTLVENFGT